MGERHGVCPNIGNCSIADSRQRVVMSDDGASSKCPECARPLIALSGPVGNAKEQVKGSSKTGLYAGVGVAAVAVVAVLGYVFTMSDGGGQKAASVPTPTAEQKTAAAPAAAPKPAAPDPAPATQAAAAPQKPAEPPAPVIRTVLEISGSNAMGVGFGLPVVEGMLSQQGYTDFQSNVTKENEFRITAVHPTTKERVGVILRARGTSTGFRELQDGKANVVFATRPVGDAEVEKLQAKFGDMRSSSNEHVLALDGISVIVHRSNPISKLTLAQITDLFSGKIDNWKQVGGNDLPVKVYAPDDNEGVATLFKDTVMAPRKAEFVLGSNRFESQARLSNAASRDPSAIGFITMPFIGPTKALAVSDGDSTPSYPSPITVATEEYPLSHRLYIYTPAADTNALATDLVTFALSKAGQDMVTKTGFVGLNVDAIRVQVAANAPPEYQKLTDGGTRLSVNFRFRTGVSQLDNKSLRDLDRVVEYVARNNVGAKRPQVMLFGFTDNVGNPDANVALSKQRAQVIGQELAARGVPPSQILGFGSALSIATNSTAEGRDRNRRVEVWVK